ncbi:MAG: glycosyltransferase [Patescibacteria group bacterium]|nr:glycosyltransferase [Patescibacteria group bacterium]
MKIAIFTNNYLPNPYGVSGSVESFRKEFEKLEHEVYIFAPRWKGYRDTNPRVFRYPAFETNIKIKFPIAIPYSRKIDKILKELDLDIIHSQHPNLLGSAAARWAKKKNIPLVFTWHTLYDQYAHFVPFVPQRLAAWWAIRNARNYADRCDAVVAPTPSVIEIIRKWGATNENITAIPTGVEGEQFENPDRESVRKKYEIKEDEILLFVMTRLTAEKNVEFLVDAVLEVLQKNEDAHPVKSPTQSRSATLPQFNRVKFMICGEGNLKDSLIKKVSETGLNDKVIFIGIVSDKEKKDYYAAGDVFVYASKSETQGMILTEAMYSGLPIVAVRATGAKDIIKDGKTGFLVAEDKEEFSHAVQKLIDDENLRKNFGEKAGKIAREKYTSSVCAKRMLEVYKKAIDDHK